MTRRRRRAGPFAVCGIWASIVLCVSIQAQSGVTLMWDPSQASNVTGYNIYLGPASHTYTNQVSVGKVTNAMVSGLSPGGSYYFAVTAVASDGLESAASNEILYNVPNTNSVPTNTPPAISSIANQVVDVNSSTPALPFTIGDAQTPATSLTLAVTSSNPGLVPNTNIVLSGSGSNQTVTVTTAGGQTGSTTIALTVCDPSLCATTTFVVTVNPLPTISLVSPTNGAVFASGATVPLTANVVANGHVITGVQFLSGGAPLGQAAIAPYSYTCSNMSCGSYSLTAQATCGSGATVLSAPVSVSVQNLPPPWQSADIGTVGMAGNAIISGDLYTVQGAGNLNNSADNFRFLYQPLSGDGEIRCRIQSVQNAGGSGCLGGMIRESLTSGSRYALMGITPNGAFRFQRRASTTGGISTSKGGSATPPACWVRLVRTGNTLSGYKSTTGTNWTLVQSSTITMATNIYVGLAVASGSSSSLNTVTFTNLVVVP